MCCTSALPKVRPEFNVLGLRPANKYATDRVSSNLQFTPPFLQTPLPCTEPDK